MTSLFGSLSSLGFKALLGATTVVTATATTLVVALKKNYAEKTEELENKFEDVSEEEIEEDRTEEASFIREIKQQKHEDPKYITDLAKRFSRLLDANSTDNTLWWRTLKANNRTLDNATLELYKGKCRAIFNTSISEIGEGMDAFKKANDDFVRINCRRPELSREKFKRNKQNYVAMARNSSANWNFEASKNVHFWKRVTDFAKARDVRYVDRLGAYCKWFPNNNWTSNEAQYTTEERDFLKYCR